MSGGFVLQGSVRFARYAFWKINENPAFVSVSVKAMRFTLTVHHKLRSRKG